MDSEATQRNRKLRSAMRHALKELHSISGDPSTGDKRLIAIGPELADLVRLGLTLLEEARGTDRARASKAAEALVPYEIIADDLVEQAMLSAERKHLAATRRALDRARKENPFDPDIWNADGLTHLNRRRYDEARDLFQEARSMAASQLPSLHRTYPWSNLRVRPFLRASYNLALTSLRTKDPARAVQLLTQCLEICPQDGVLARFLLPEAHLANGQPEEAIAAYRNCLEGNLFDLPDPHFSGAAALFSQDRIEEATQWLLHGLALNRHIPHALTHPVDFLHHEFRGVDSPGYAAAYARDHKHLWDSQARRWIRRMHQDPTLHQILNDPQLQDDPTLDWHARQTRAEQLRARLNDPQLLGRLV